MLIYCKLLLLILTANFAIAVVNNAVKTDFLLERVQIVGEKGVADFTKLRSIKVNRTTYALNGTIEILQDIGNDILVGVELWEFQGGEYRKTQFRLPQRAWCDFSKSETFYLPAVWETTNFPPLGQCPLPEGVYYMKNFVPDPEKLPKFLNGRYMINIITDRVGESSDISIKCFIEIKRYPAI